MFQMYIHTKFNMRSPTVYLGIATEVWETDNFSHGRHVPLLQSTKKEQTSKSCILFKGPSPYIYIRTKLALVSFPSHKFACQSRYYYAGFEVLTAVVM
jgi:hypothetical protein